MKFSAQLKHSQLVSSLLSLRLNSFRSSRVFYFLKAVIYDLLASYIIGDIDGFWSHLSYIEIIRSHTAIMWIMLEWRVTLEEWKTIVKSVITIVYECESKKITYRSRN